MNYVICETKDGAYTAGSKARDDISEIMEGLDGWHPFLMDRHWSTSGVLDKCRSLYSIAHDWTQLVRTLSRGDTLLVQFPISVGPKLSEVPAWFMERIQNKGVRIVFLLHDVEYLRGKIFPWEHRMLSCADAMIVHNDAMKCVLEKRYAVPMISLGIFDYLTDCDWAACEDGIDIAGNLDCEKAGYVYQFSDRDLGVTINLFGPNYSGNPSDWIVYHGKFSPEELPAHLRGKFGLVWDGPSLNTCSGSYGDYLRINNPHKLSLYLALGKPVIIWDGAAEASFVERHHVGITASSVPAAIERCRSMHCDDYARMKQAAEVVGRELRSGANTKRALSKVTAILNG